MIESMNLKELYIFLGNLIELKMNSEYLRLFIRKYREDLNDIDLFNQKYIALMSTIKKDQFINSIINYVKGTFYRKINNMNSSEVNSFYEFLISSRLDIENKIDENNKNTDLKDFQKIKKNRSLISKLEANDMLNNINDLLSCSLDTDFSKCGLKELVVSLAKVNHFKYGYEQLKKNVYVVRDKHINDYNVLFDYSCIGTYNESVFNVIIDSIKEYIDINLLGLNNNELKEKSNFAKGLVNHYDKLISLNNNDKTIDIRDKVNKSWQFISLIESAEYLEDCIENKINKIYLF